MQAFGAAAQRAPAVQVVAMGFRRDLGAVLAGAFVAVAEPAAADVCARLLADRQTLRAEIDSDIAWALAAEKDERWAILSDMRARGCPIGSIMVLGAGTDRSDCDRLDRALAASERRIGDLERRNGGRAEPAALARLSTRLRAEGCLEDPADPGFSQYRDGKGEMVEILRGGASGSFRPARDFPPRGGLYQTMCVRLCDGFYFPVSPATAPRDFGRDAGTCAAMCPGIDTRLYFFSPGGEDAEDMISARHGEPYRALPSAFAYRRSATRGDGACQCDLKAYQRRARALGSPDGTGIAPPRPSGIIDYTSPDANGRSGTARDGDGNRRGDRPPEGADSAASRSVQPGSAPRPERPMPDRPVRIIGSPFLPQEDQRLDLTNPQGPPIPPGP